MRRFIITWRQEEQRKPGKRPNVQTFEDVIWAANLAGAVEAWGRNCYCNADVVAVRLAENVRAEKARTVGEGRAGA